MQKCKIYFRFQSTSTKLFSLSIYLPIQHFSVRATSIFCPNLSIGIPHDKPLTNGKNNEIKQLPANVSRKFFFSQSTLAKTCLVCNVRFCWLYLPILSTWLICKWGRRSLPVLENIRFNRDLYFNQTRNREF